jgi:photosystem II stability/assembly factor-like uncharacterized protein
MKRIFTLLFVLTYSFLTFSQSWSALTSGTTATLGSLYFVNDNIGWTVGVGGLIKKTTNGGSTWVSQNSGVTTDLIDIAFSDANTGYISGRSGKVLKTTDAGATWTGLPSGVTADLTKIFINGNDIYIDGYNGLIIKSSNAGVSWIVLSSGSTAYLYGNYFISPTTGYAVGSNGTIIKTTNAGSNWSSLTSGTTFQLQSVFFTDVNNGYITGGDISGNTGIILKTIDGGATWTNQTFPNNYFGTIRFLTPSIGYVAGGSITANTSTILKTMDGGVNWIVQPSSSSRQFGAFFPGFGTGYTCGLNGTVLKTTGINIGINEIEDAYVTLETFPNPFEHSLSVKFNLAKGISVAFELTDITGRVFKVISPFVYRVGTHELSISELSDLPAGIYFLNLITEDGKETRKIVKL